MMPAEDPSTAPDSVPPAHLPLGWQELVQLFAQTQEAMQSQAARSVDSALVVRNWLFGWYLVEYQQHGADRAEYGEKLLKRLAPMLKIRGCSERNLASFRKFYLSYADILQAVPAKSTRSQLPAIKYNVNYFDRHVKTAEERPTVGILLCLSKSDELVELTLPENSNIYASEYQLYLPSKEELKQQLAEIHEDWDLKER